MAESDRDPLRNVLAGAAERGWLAGFRFDPKGEHDRETACHNDVILITNDMERRLEAITLPPLTSLRWRYAAFFTGGFGGASLLWAVVSTVAAHHG